ncbi:hypothetical protein B0H65DRAFT_480367 [Neurospora tetraspora]|uniref:Uncharacterized protein n=1 Tax=Neurospora tetraspora TaxID=94610 RepID=A0AAE0J0Y4_9PEZI|nr:hypothetical protein B0H65DRAFT_480367 [Neurospora tetraspora]
MLLRPLPLPTVAAMSCPHVNALRCPVPVTVKQCVSMCFCQKQAGAGRHVIAAVAASWPSMSCIWHPRHVRPWHYGVEHVNDVQFFCSSDRFS